ncbi:unnamed protein product, partial [Owenia fusiformis]
FTSMASSPMYGTLSMVSENIGAILTTRNDASRERIITETDFVTTFISATTENSTTNVTLNGNVVTTVDEDDTLEHAKYYDVHILIIVCIMCSAAILGNSLLIAVLNQIPGKKTHLLIINLAIGDLGEAAMFLIDEIIYPWTGSEPCVTMVTSAIFRMFDCVSILSLFALAISQTMAICRPLHYPSLVTRTRVRMTVLIIWLVSLVLPLIGILVPLGDSNWASCSWTHIAYDVTEWIFSIVLIFEVFVIIVLYVRAYLQVQAYKNRKSELTQGMSVEQNRKAFLTTMIVLSTLVITWLPYLMYRFFVWNIMFKFNPDSVTEVHTDVYMNFIVFLPVVNTISDPIIYGARMPDVQRGLKRFFKCCQKNRDIQRNDTTSFTTSLRTNTKVNGTNNSIHNAHLANVIKKNMVPVEVNVAKNGNHFHMTIDNKTPNKLSNLDTTDTVKRKQEEKCIRNQLQNDLDTSAETRL